MKDQAECSKCETKVIYEKNNDSQSEITIQTGYVLTDDGWLCEACFEDLVHSEGC